MARPSFSVRLPRISDIPGMVRIATQAFTETVRRPRVGTSLVEMFNDQSFRWSRVAVENGKVIGYLVGNLLPGGAKISQFAVHPANWRKGIGRAMVSSFERAARKKRAPLIMVGTTYARGFYEKCGFNNVCTVHRLAKTLPGSVLAPNPVPTQTVTLDSVSLAIDAFPRTRALEFLDLFYDRFMSPGAQALYTMRGKMPVAASVLFPHEICSEFCVANIVCANDSATALQTLHALEHAASSRGYMWLGVSVSQVSPKTLAFFRANRYTSGISDPVGALKPSMLDHLGKQGYTDLQLGIWSTLYWLIKNLT